MNSWKEFIAISYVFLLFVVGEKDLIGFSWLLYWYFPHITDIVVEGFWCCLILCLWIDFFFIEVPWW